MGYTLHFISHTHWDREWYMSFESHRVRLVEMLDKLFEAFESNPDFISFHLDGQVIILEDYLEIRPYMLDRIKRYVAEGRLVIGPWYVLQDEFLTSGEANIRNLLYGIRKGEKYGPVCMVGYFPDAFGNISQAPQILKGFGIGSAVFGRGICLTGSDGTSGQCPKDEKYNSELIWTSPDGSEVLGILLANWYNNASEVPHEPEKAKAFIETARDKAARFAATPHLLLMNGSDHQPVQVELPEILKVLQSGFADDLLVHSDFNTYIGEIEKYRSSLKKVEGELAGQFTDGNGTLVNTASSRLYLKQLNHKAQILLEKWVEPFGVMAWSLGDSYRTDFINKAWQYLLQNHPHDSICGCNVDDVHEEMVARFKKSIAISEEMINREIRYLVSKINTSSLEYGEIPIIVFNPLNWDISEQVKAYADFDEDDKITKDGLSLKDADGNQVPSNITEIGRVFTYNLPDDSFRKVRYVKRFEFVFTAEHVPGLGYKTFTVNRNICNLKNRLHFGANCADNSYIRLDINSDGSLKITDKMNGNVYNNLNVFEDSGDLGDEYKYTGMHDNKIYTTQNKKPEVEIFSKGSTAVTFRIRHSMNLPYKADKLTARRKDENTVLILDSYVTLASDSRRVDISTEFNNNIYDHRLRVMFPADIDSEYCYADGQLDIVKRKIKPWEGWTNPSNCQRQQTFVDLHNENRGLVIANKGLPEYEVLRDGRNTIALTLVRSVGEMGDWGYFPTPGAQCEGMQKVEYSIIPYPGETRTADAYKQAYQFNILPLTAVQSDIHRGELGLEKSFVTIRGKNIILSALKKCEDRETAIIRLCNTGYVAEKLEVDLQGRFDAAFITDMNEQRLEPVEVSGRHITADIPSRRIMTFEFSRKEDRNNYRGTI